MAVFLTPEDENEQPEDPPQPPSPIVPITTAPTVNLPKSASFTSDFVDRIRTDDDYSCVSLRQCEDCGRSVATVSRGTQWSSIEGHL